VACASERTPPKCVAAVAVCYNPPPACKTTLERCHLLCVAAPPTIIRKRLLAISLQVIESIVARPSRITRTRHEADGDKGTD